MRLWRKASGVLKDQHSLWLACLSQRTALRNPDIESAVIKATNHDEFSIDFKNTDRVYKWIRLSPSHLKPLVWSISHRMDKTRYWVVALKGLMLMHGVINCKVPAVPKIGRLPFDLSNFKDGHSRPGKIWSHNAFVRSYYRFLDQKSIFIFQTCGVHERRREVGTVIMHELVLLQKLQGLLDLLIQIKPLSKAAMVPLILEAMDRMIIEIFDIYGVICRGIAVVLTNICCSSKVEATVALKIVQKAIIHSEQLSSYFEFCENIGVVIASELPSIERVPDEGIQELQKIVKGFPEKSEWVEKHQEAKNNKAIVVVTDTSDFPTISDDFGGKDSKKNDFRTIITDKWESFDEDLIKFDEDLMIICQENTVPKNPFESSLPPPPLLHHHDHHHHHCQELPDLISFL